MNSRRTTVRILVVAAVFLAGFWGPAVAQEGAADEAAELAKKLQNPVASLISVPMQNNWDFGIGSANAMRYTLNVQPVIPFSLTKEWNLITRTIVPIIYAESPVVGGDNTGGLGDIVQSFFFSPSAPTSGGWMARHRRYAALASLVRRGLIGVGIRPLLPEGASSVVLNAYHLPDGMEYDTLHDRLKERGFVIYAGQGGLARRIFRVSTMGAIAREDMERFLEAVKGIVSGA